MSDLTCVRAVFAAWVFAYHVNLQISQQAALGAFAPLLTRGYLGVDGFFMLSGLVLSLAHPRLRLDLAGLRRFWARRLLRIYPVHLAMLALLVLMLGMAWSQGIAPRQPGQFGLADLVRSLLLVQAWGFGGHLAWNYPSWSVSTEWAGYLAFPWLCWAVRGLRPAALAALLAGLFALLLGENLARVPASLNVTDGAALARFFPEFLAGMGLARLEPALRTRLPGRALACAGLCLVVVAGLALPDAAVVMGEALCLMGLLLAARQGHAPVLARVPGLLGAGVISYAFYMSFAPVEALQTFLWRRLEVVPGAHPALFVLLTTAMTAGLGLAAWALVERPAQRLGRPRKVPLGVGVLRPAPLGSAAGSTPPGP